MTSKLIKVGIEETLANVRLLMIDNGIGRIPVFDNEKIAEFIRERKYQGLFL